MHLKIFRFILKPTVSSGELERMERTLIDWSRRLNIHANASGEGIQVRKFLSAIAMVGEHDLDATCSMLASLLLSWHKDHILQLVDMSPRPPQICDLKDFIEAHEVPAAIALGVPADIFDMQRKRKRRPQLEQPTALAQALAPPEDNLQEEEDPEMKRFCIEANIKKLEIELRMLGLRVDLIKCILEKQPDLNVDTILKILQQGNLKQASAETTMNDD